MGTAVKAGSSHVVFWLLAIAAFFVPQALVVIHMSRRLPVEGGLYEWARIAFNDQIGFLVAWNLWLYSILYVGLGGLLTVSFRVLCNSRRRVDRQQQMGDRRRHFCRDRHHDVHRRPRPRHWQVDQQRRQLPFSSSPWPC